MKNYALYEDLKDLYNKTVVPMGDYETEMTQYRKEHV